MSTPQTSVTAAGMSPGLASAIVVISASAWGLYWLPIRILEEAGLSSAWSVLALNLPAALLLMVLFLASLRQQVPHLRAALGIGVFTGMGLACYGLSLAETSVVRATLLFYLTPVWGTLIGIYWLGEPASWQRWAAIGLGFVGLMLLVAGIDARPLNVGDLLALISGMAWAIGSAMIKRSGQIPLVGMTMAQYLAMCVITLGIGALLGPIAPPSAAQIADVAVLAVAVSIGAILPGVYLLFRASQVLYPGRVGLLMMSEALVAFVSASLLLPDEALSLMQWGGAALIIGASLLELTPGAQKT